VPWATPAEFLEIGGQDADRYPALRHRDTANRGSHTVHTGFPTASTLIFAAADPPRRRPP
jgi:hypothetical protein